MDLQTRFIVLASVVSLALTAYGLVRSLLRNRAERRRQRHLDEAGLTARGRVAAVEPMQRPVNGAAGHPVRLSFDDQAGRQRECRDTSGLGGYVVREGSQVTVRYSPTDPEVVRVEEIIGPHGGYPVERNRRTPSPVPALAALAVVVALGVAVPLTQSGTVTMPELGAELVPPAFGLIGLGILVVSGTLAIRRAARRRPSEEVGGVVTEVWNEHANTGRGSGTTVHPFTVHFATRDGREVHTRYRVASSRRFDVYRRVRVRYDPAYPPSFDVAELRYARWLLWLIPTFIGIVFLLIGAFWVVARFY